MWGGTDQRESIATIQAALHQGINLIDTAPVYGFGVSEEIVGAALEGMRTQAVIATKTGLEWRDGKVYRNATRARIMQEVDDSLRTTRAPITSTSTRSIGPTLWCRSRKPPRPCARFTSRERSAPSA